MNNRQEQIRQYLVDFKKILELMSKTMNTYCTEFLQTKGLPNPFSEENIRRVYEQLNTCSSDEEYAEIVNSFLQSFKEGHLFLKNGKYRFDSPKPTEVTPLYVKQVEGKYVISATKDESLEGQELTSINGVPIEQYLIDKGYRQDVEMKIYDQESHPISPEFHVNEDNCTITMTDGSNVQIDNIPSAEANKLKQEKEIEDSPNVICGYTADGIPYVRIKSLNRDKLEEAKQQLDLFATKLNDQQQTDLVIDIRGNKGGSDEYIGLLGAFSDGTYSQELKYKILTGMTEEETNDNLNNGNIEDINTILERIETTPNRKVERHETTISQPPTREKQSVKNRLLLVDGQVFSSADKMAKVMQDSGFATIVGSELTAGDGEGFSIHQVDTPILRKQGLSITMPSSMGLDYSKFQTTPDIMTSEHEINTNLGQIMEQVKHTIIEWKEITPQQTVDYIYDLEENKSAPSKTTIR